MSRIVVRGMAEVIAVLKVALTQDTAYVLVNDRTVMRQSAGGGMVGVSATEAATVLGLVKQGCLRRGRHLVSQDPEDEPVRVLIVIPDVRRRVVRWSSLVGTGV